MARLKFQKEKSELKANDPQAETPKKKRGRPKDPRLLQRKMKELCAEFESSMVEDESSDPMEDGEGIDESDGGNWKDIEREWE